GCGHMPGHPDARAHRRDRRPRAGRPDQAARPRQPGAAANSSATRPARRAPLGPRSDARGEGVVGVSIPPEHPSGLLIRKPDLTLARPTRWAWQHRIAVGYLNLLIGDEGIGK